MFKKIGQLFLTLILLPNIVYCQTADWSSGQIRLHLEQLKNTSSVLYIAAHPDDENTELLTWLVNERKVRTGYLSLTRGEGGQNLIGTEQGEMLGVLRTQELLAARKIDGAEQFFSRAYDFGFTKNPEEVFRFWEHDSILSDVVWVIRKFRPDVIITRFPSTGEGGHGQHTASAILAEEAFHAAADSTKFPEQLQYVSVWKAKRLFTNTLNFGAINTTSPDQLTEETGQYNSLLGKSYGEIAALSRSQHRCQGMGTAADHGSSKEYFKLLAGDPAKNDLFDGINISDWTKIDPSGKFLQELNNVISHFDDAHPENSVDGLTHLFELTYQLTDVAILNLKQDQLTQLIMACSGMYLSATAMQPTIVKSGKLKIILEIRQRKNTNLKCLGYIYPMKPDALNAAVYRVKDGVEMHDGIFKDTITVTLPDQFNYTTPYYLASQKLNNIYTVQKQTLRGLPENPSPLSIRYLFHWGSERNIVVNMPIVYKWVDPSIGEKSRGVAIVPPASLSFQSNLYFYKDPYPKDISVTVTANMDSVNGRISLQLPQAWRSVPEFYNVNLAKRDQKQVFTFKLTPGVSPLVDNEFNLFASLKLSNGNEIEEQVSTLQYDHIPTQIRTQRASAKLIYAPLNVNVKTVAYLKGAGDQIPAALEQMGIKVKMITPDDLKDSTRWKDWDAIITGVRFFNINDDAQNILPLLLQYTSNGGNLIMQYNTDNHLNISTPGPYPFAVSKSRVTDENSKVVFTNPDDPILHSPNEITIDDFNNWIQERGVYFPDKIDKHYKTVFEMHDAGENALNNSVIYTSYGKGKFVYTGLSFFRELPAGVPGAYRIFSNLIGRNK